MSSRKKRGLSGFFDQQGALVLLSVCFFVGSLMGCLLARGMTDCAELRSYTLRYVSAAANGGLGLRLPPMVFDTIRIPLLVVLLGFTFLGPVGIPCIFVLRGFCFCFSVSCFVRISGLAGLAAAFMLLGISALIWAPAFFLLGGQGMKCSYGILCRCAGEHRGFRLPERLFFIQLSLCFFLFVASSLVEYWLIPMLLPIVGRFL